MQKIKNEGIGLKEEDFLPPTPPPESDWRLGKYFDAMNDVEGYPEPPEFEEIEGYISNCTDTDMDDSASVLYAYNYLKEYVKHMKSAKQAKNNLMSVLPSQEGMTPNYRLVHLYNGYSLTELSNAIPSSWRLIVHLPILTNNC